MRKVTIINSRTQSQTVLQSEATTLGQLKQEMSAKGIDYRNMTFYEGYSRTELIDDASVLPTNIPYKGQIVNDLVFQLTTTNKKIASGLYNRTELYAKIKEYNLTETCKSKFGRNFTQCSTDNLNALVLNYESQMNTKSEVETPKCEKAQNTKESCTCTNTNVEVAFRKLLEVLYDCEYLDEDDYYDIISTLNDTNKISDDPSDKLSKKEINELFDFIN